MQRRLPLLTALTLVAFAGNSLLCRAALGRPGIDPESFTAIRLASGALFLVVLLRVRSQGRPAGTMGGGASLAVYALLFSWAYVRIPAGVGALVLFALVQLTMITWAIRSGAGPRGLQWVGLGLALGGLAALTLPGSAAPDGFGVLLMAGSGVAWGVYSLIGRGSTQPVADTAGNFVRALPVVLIAAAVAMLDRGLSADARGVGLAVASGALASGGGYVLWYTVLPSLGATRAAALQLLVPVIASVGGVLLLGEELTPRLGLAGAAILGGVALATLRRDVSR